jgi:hypothetical protein
MADVSGDGAAWWGDVEFGYRAGRIGYRFFRCLEAESIHRDYSIATLESTCQRMEKASRMVHELFLKCPGIETHLPMFKDKMAISWSRDSAGLVFRKVIRHLTSTDTVISLLFKTTDCFERNLPKPWILRPLYRWCIGGHIFRGFHSRPGSPDTLSNF